MITAQDVADFRALLAPYLERVKAIGDLELARETPEYHAYITAWCGLKARVLAGEAYEYPEWEISPQWLNGCPMVLQWRKADPHYV